MPERVIWGGRYVIHDVLASGGMATVYLAARLGPSTEIPAVVALKRLSDQYAKQPEFVAMFLDEAHLAARIRHPNVVTTYEFLRTDEGLGIVMDLVVGESLMALTRGRSEEARVPPPLEVTLAVVAGALDGLHAAHEVRDDTGRSLHLVHRDVSPHNIIVSLDGVARVIDFGVAKAVGRLQTTDVGVLKGKFAYMSPEQIAAREVDRRTDVYAAGIVLWETLAGRKLFDAKTNEALLMMRSAGTFEIPLPSTLNAAVSPALDSIVQRALASDPGARFASAKDMAEAIRAEHAVADASAVAAWVSTCSGEKLRLLEARRRDLEGAPGPSSSPRRFGEDLVLGEGAFLDAGGAPTPLELDARAAPIARKSVPGTDRPSLPGRSGRYVSRPETSRSYGAVFLLLVLLLVAGLGGAAWLRGPSLLRARTLAAADDLGVALSFERVEVGHAGLRLVGVRASLAGSPSVRLAAADVDVDLDRGGRVRGVSLPGYDLTLSGTPAAIGAEVAEWQRAHPLSFAVRGTEGHVLWSFPAIPGLTFEALGASLALDRAPDATLSLDSTSVFANLPHGHTGPWQAHVASRPTETRARIGLEPMTVGSASSASVVARPAEGATWLVDVPRTSTFKLGIPAELFGIAYDVDLEIALHGRLGPSGESLTAEGQVGVYGLSLAAGRSARLPVDLLVTGKIAGDPRKPLALDAGKVAIGKTTTAVSGTVVLAPEGLRVEIDRPATHGAPSPSMVLDTREWTTVAGPSGATTVAVP